MSRRSIDAPGLGHGAAPVSDACLLDGWLLSGTISGLRPGTKDLGESLEEQLSLMFANVDAVAQAAGATMGDIGRVTIWMADPHERAQLDKAWGTAFPDPASRPVRHVLRGDFGPWPVHVQCSFDARVGAADASAARP